ncbi:MAG: site-specific integrase [Phascolarctobacterium sp.]|nr:site-specific integrase [Candidatus Phascolarctobacterium caballi]
MYQSANGIWAEAITLKNGKKKFFYGKTKADVKQKMAAWSAESEKGKTFAEIAKAWQIYHEQQTTYNTVSAYNGSFKRAVERFGDIPLKDITADEIQAYITNLGNMGYARRTVQMSKNMLKMIFDYAIIQADSEIKYNPVTAVKIPSGLSRSRRLPPKDEEIAKVKPDSEMGLFAFFLLYTGLRRGELLALRWEDIDRVNKIIHVTKEVYYEGNEAKVKPPKTDAGIRDVDLLDILNDALPTTGTGYVFGGEKPLTRAVFTGHWAEWCRSIGLAEERTLEYTRANGAKYKMTKLKPLVTPHQFRHAYASLLDDAGLDETTAKTLLGHSSITVTKDVYTHLREAKRQRSASALNDFINSKI